jgi:XTP/dITP diphosphohydrolase
VRLLLASHNAHKLREFERMLAAGGGTTGAGDGAGTGGTSGAGEAPNIELDALPGDFELPPEDGETFEANALGKARAAASGCGRPAIADDSGIAAAALGGAPGVRSARYAGEHASDEENLAKLMREVPAGGALEYVCAIAYVDPVGGRELVVEGRCTGTLAAEPRGEGGFGYDPAFLPDEGPPGLTMAELPDERKDAISHRGRALQALLAALRAG